MAGSLVLRLVGAAFAFLIGIQLARYLGAENYGTYAVYMAFVSLTAGLAQFGLAPLAMREIARFFGSLAMKHQIAWFVRRTIVIGLFICLLSGLLVVVFFPGSPLRDSTVLLAGLALAFLISFTSVLGAILRGAQNVLKGQLSEIVITPALFSLFLFFCWLLSHEATPGGALALHLLAAAGAFLVSAWFTWRLYISATGGEAHHWVSAGITRAALPVWLADIIRAINASYPLIVLAILLSEEGTGIYKVTLSCAAILNLPLAISNIAAGPFLANIQAGGDTVRLQRLHALIGCVLFGLMLSAMATIWLFGTDLVVFAFGDQFGAAATPLLVLSASLVITAFFGISPTFMIIAGGQRYVFYSYLISVSTAIVAAVNLVPALGLAGVALAEVLMATIWHLFIWSVCRRKFGYDLSLFGLVTAVGKRSPDRTPQVAA